MEFVKSKGYDKDIESHFLIFLPLLKISGWKDISEK